MDSTRNLDSNWRDVADHVRSRSPNGSGYVTPHPFRHILKDVTPVHEAESREFQDFAGLVLHKGFYQEYDASLLYQFLERAVPTFANAVFVVLEANGTGLPRNHKHLKLLPGIRKWAAANAEPAQPSVAAGEEDSDANWLEVTDYLKSRPDGRYAAPESFRAANTLSLGELGTHAPEELTGLVLDKGLYKKIDASFLHRFLGRAKPVLANSVFIVLEVTGAPLPRGNRHLGALPLIRKWARDHADPAFRKADDDGQLPADLSEDARLRAMARFIAEHLCRPVDPAAPEPVLAVAETAERFNDTEWFWVDDTGKAAELFALPQIRDAYPHLADAMLDFMLRLSPGSLIHRRAAAPGLKLVSAEPRKFFAYNNFFNLSGDLSKGFVAPSIRYNDDRTKVNARYGGNSIHLRASGRSHSASIDDTIASYGIAEEADRVIVHHTSAIACRGLLGKGAPLCEVTYRYTLWRSRPELSVSVSVMAAPGVRLEDVELTTGFDRINPERGFKTAIIGQGETFQSYAAPSTVEEHPSKGPKVTLATGPKDYLCLYESSWMPGFANGIHSRLHNAEQVAGISAQGSLQGSYHWVGIRYALGALAGGESAGIAEDRLLTGGGYYHKPEIYRGLMTAAPNGEIDPSVSYDIGAELNAVGVYLLFAGRGAYQVSPPSEERKALLKAWYDRHLDIYLEILRPGEEGDGQRVFFRGLAFVILSLDCMARAYPDFGYQDKLQSCVRLLLRLETPIPLGMEESLFGWPELDCQVAALLALARAAWWGDEGGAIGGVIRRALRAISISAVHADPSGKVNLLHNTLLVRNDAGDQDTGYWNFKLGLSVRAFHAIARMQTLGKLKLDQETMNHLELLDMAARLLLKQSMLWEDGKIEVLTSQKSGETNSETQPWTALGLVPAVEQAIMG